MSPPGVPSAVPSPPELRITCPACAAELLVAPSRRTESGPCPKCGAGLDPAVLLPRATGTGPEIPAPGGGKAKFRARTDARGRVRPDGFIDHDYNERREMYGTLRVLAVFLGAGAVILFVIIYGRQFMAG